MFIFFYFINRIFYLLVGRVGWNSPTWQYLQLEYFICNAEYILLKNEKNLIYFKINNCLYQFVIKNPKNGRENFLTTFHKTNIKQLNKDIAWYKQIKREFWLWGLELSLCDLKFRYWDLQYQNYLFILWTIIWVFQS